MESSRYEIVRVIDEHSLIDSESYQRCYRRPHGAPLQPGFYAVVCADPDASLQYDASAEFAGPFASPALARTAMEGRQPVLS